MKKSYFLVILLFFTSTAMCQYKKFKAVELTIQLRHELQGSYTFQYGTVPYLNSIKIYGTSLGANISYKIWFRKGWYFAPSIGYYKFSVGEIVNRTIPSTIFDGDSRFIDYRPDSTPIGYATRRYHYNNFSLGVVGGKDFRLSERYQLTTGLAINYLYSYSANYNVGSTNYRTFDDRSFGYTVTGQFGIRREYKKLYVAAHLLVPFYKQWKRDKVLYENPNETTKTWLGGNGISLTLGKYLK